MNRYVTDTHSILWHLSRDRRLSRAARNLFVSANEGRLQVLVPSIVLMEAVFLAQRRRISEAQVSQLFRLPEDEYSGIRLAPLDLAVSHAVRDFGPSATPDMPDRIIAATARAWGVPLITVDSVIAESGLVDVVW
jgi:PIN domain nuclease of toxin-antitoxin system